MDSDSQYHRWLLSMVDLLEWLASQLNVEVDGLAQLVRERGWCPPAGSGVQWHHAMEAMLRDVEKIQDGPHTLRRLSPCAPARSVEVLHWRTLVNIIASRPELQDPLRALPLISEVRESMPSELGPPIAADSHCHLASFVAMKGGRLRPVLEEALMEVVEDPHTITPAVTRIVDNRVFYREWRQPEFDNPWFHYAWGVGENGVS